jgi:hypothetical protein
MNQQAMRKETTSLNSMEAFIHTIVFVFPKQLHPSETLALSLNE